MSTSFLALSLNRHSAQLESGGLTEQHEKSSGAHNTVMKLQAQLQEQLGLLHARDKLSSDIRGTAMSEHHHSAHRGHARCTPQTPAPACSLARQRPPQSSGAQRE